MLDHSLMPTRAGAGLGPDLGAGIPKQVCYEDGTNTATQKPVASQRPLLTGSWNWMLKPRHPGVDAGVPPRILTAWATYCPNVLNLQVYIPILF